MRVLPTSDQFNIIMYDNMCVKHMLSYLGHKILINGTLTVPRRYFFCGFFYVFLSLFAVPLSACVYMCHVVTCWEKARLWCITVSLSLSHWYPGSGVVLDCSDS